MQEWPFSGIPSKTEVVRAYADDLHQLSSETGTVVQTNSGAKK